MKLNKILLVIAIIIASLLIFIVVKYPTNKVDYQIMDFAYDIRRKPLTIFFKIISYIGSVYGVITILLIILIAYWKDKRTLWLISVVIVSTIINTILKLIIARDRPLEIMRLVTENSKSFPSGHSMQAMSLYGSIIYLAIINKTKYRNFIIIGSILMIILMGFSRIYLGVHYFTDVIGAYTIGLVVVLLMSLILKIKEPNGEKSI